MYAAALETNLTAGARAGTTLTADGTPHTEASAWTSLVASTDSECQGFYLRVSAVAANLTDTGMLLDIAYGDVGGGNEVAVVNDISVGQADLTSSGIAIGKTYFFPQVIPTTKSVSARIRAAQASDTCVVAIWLKQGCVHLEDVGTAITYGVSTAASRGTSVPDASGAFGAWTEIATTSQNHNLFHVAYDALSDTSLANGDILVQIGYGAAAPGSGGTAIDAVFLFTQHTIEAINGPFPSAPVYAVVASGTKLWARIAGVSTENRGISIYGMSGTEPASGSGGSNNIF